MPKLKRGKSQVLFRYLPGAVFLEGKKWYMVNDMKLTKLTEKTDHLYEMVSKFVEGWTANSGLSINLYPSQQELYYFAEIEQIEFSLFPLVFHCNNNRCENVHEYYSMEDLSRKNPELKCQFCKIGNLKQYPYALIHPNGDIQSIAVKKNNGAKTWREKYDGIRMRDTRRFTTATWYNYKRNISLGELGIKSTSLPLTEDMLQSNKRFLGGTHLSEGDVHYPALRSMVNLEQGILQERQNHANFVHIQLAGLLGVQSLNKDYSQNFQTQETSNTLQILLQSVANAVEKEILLKTIQNSNLNNQLSDQGIVQEVEQFFNGQIPNDLVVNDRLLHEFLYSWYENGSQTLDAKIEEAGDRGDSLQETTYIQAKQEVRNLGIDEVALLEKFPVVTMGIGYTRKSLDRRRSILNPFKKNFGNKKHVVIPVLKNENEAIIFKLDPLRIYKWLEINDLVSCENPPKNKQEAHAFLFNFLEFSRIDPADLVMIDPTDYLDNRSLLSAIVTYQLIHTIMHMLLHSGKSIIGLDVDSMAEYTFPSALAGAIYVSKLQGGGMGALIAAFENDLERWLRNTYEKSQTCLYDPICKGQQGACHACSHLKFSCQHFNRGVSRNLLTGGYKLGEKILKGYFSPEIDNLILKE
ncbi:hypothetical protein ABE143_07240 [Bacillus subtilis]